MFFGIKSNYKLRLSLDDIVLFLFKKGYKRNFLSSNDDRWLHFLPFTGKLPSNFYFLAH